MKITGLRTTIVTVPFCKPYTWRLGRCNGITSVLAEVTTDQGLIGIGESPCFFPPADAIKATMDSTEPLLIGEDPFDHERIYKRILGMRGLYYDRIFAGLALSGIDLALWDLMGKSTAQPLYKLIGGRVHQEARFICILSLGEPHRMAEDSMVAVQNGCQTIYVKYDGDEQQLIDRLKAIRSVVGAEPRIRVDFNQGLAPGFAVQLIRRLEPFDLEAVEQPCGEEDYGGLHYIRQQVGTPVIADESSKTFYHAFNTIRADGADIIEVDPYTSDGIWGVRKICGMAEAAGLPVVLHSVGELGLNQMKLVHLAVSTPNATLDHQTLYDYNSDDVVQGGPLEFDRWTMRPLESPGLGLELDADKVRYYNDLYRRQGGLYVTGETDLEKSRDKVPLFSSHITRTLRQGSPT